MITVLEKLEKHMKSIATYISEMICMSKCKSNFSTLSIWSKTKMVSYNKFKFFLDLKKKFFSEKSCKAAKNTLILKQLRTKYKSK